MDPLRDAAQAKAQSTGWNGVFTDFKAHSYKTQVFRTPFVSILLTYFLFCPFIPSLFVYKVVAGTNYFVKVQYAEGKFAHLRIYEVRTTSRVGFF